MITNQQIIYLDNNATTPIDKRVLDAMIPFLTDIYANAASTHFFGLSVNEAVKNARQQVANLIGVEPQEVIFTSGATEAINMALKGIAENYTHRGSHIITVSTEHSAVLDTCRNLEQRGMEVTYLPVQSDGLLDLSVLKAAIRADTILVSVMYVNNETGVIQPINEIAEIAHASGALFMTDATQAVGKIPIDVDTMGIDLLCMSGHKIYAPKGVGALYVRQRKNRVKLPALLHGGGHERGWRSGTLNVPGIVALGVACSTAKEEMHHDAERVAIMRDKLEQEMLNYPHAFVNGSIQNRAFNVSSICFPGIDANVLIGRMKDVAVSNGSACSSAIVEPSHVLKSMGLTDDDAFASIRFSLGRFNTESDIEAVTKIFHDLLTPIYA